MIENLDQNQIIFILAAMAASAVIVGFMAGFFGIGGGLIMVPILFYLFIEITNGICQREKFEKENLLKKEL